MSSEIPTGRVLVVGHLDPRLAAVIPRLAGLIAETGSPLSHLAILAREHGVPTVVGLAGATTRFADGDVVAVDGHAGTVTPVDPNPPSIVWRWRHERRAKIGGAAAIATLLASGLYFFLYLYRWEWNRAQVAAAIFVAAEVGIVGWLVSDRIRRVERRLDRMAATAQERRLHILREHAPAPTATFAWLQRTDRVARVHPRPARRRRRALRSRVGRRALVARDGRPGRRAAGSPAGSVPSSRRRAVSSTAATTRWRSCADHGREARRRVRRRRSSRWPRCVFGMAEVTQNRPDEVRAGSQTTVTFTVATRDVQRGEPAAAAALWAVCAGTVGGEVSPAPDRAGDAWR